jgi:hypothetical protein
MSAAPLHAEGHLCAGRDNRHSRGGPDDVPRAHSQAHLDAKHIEVLRQENETLREAVETLKTTLKKEQERNKLQSESMMSTTRVFENIARHAEVQHLELKSAHD